MGTTSSARGRAAGAVLVLAGAAVAATVALASDWSPKTTGITLGSAGVVGFVAALATFGKVQTAVIGGDQRISTSKAQAALWTLAIGFGMLVSLGHAWADDDGGESWGALLDRTFSDGYLLLLGGPYVALVGARAIVGSQLNKGTLQKTVAAEKPHVRDLLADDDGKFDIVDCQFLFFTAIALVYFLAQMTVNPGSGLPPLPSTLAALMTGSTGAFLGTKLANANPAAITSVRPDQPVAGARVVVYGRNLAPPGSAGRHGELWLDTGATLQVEAWGDDEVRATLPGDTSVGEHTLHLRTLGGGEADARIDVTAPALEAPGTPTIEDEEPPTEAPAGFYGTDDPLAGLPDDDADDTDDDASAPIAEPAGAP